MWVRFSFIVASLETVLRFGKGYHFPIAGSTKIRLLATSIVRLRIAGLGVAFGQPHVLVPSRGFGERS